MLAASYRNMTLKEKILEISNHNYDSFDRAAEYAFDTLGEKLNELTNKESFKNPNFVELSKDLKNRNASADEYVETIFSFLPELISNIGIHANIEQEMFSLCEMKIIHHYKNIEIAIKRIIKIAYPEISTKDLFAWKDLINFFNTKNINIYTLKGYKEIDELRKVNNNIKHGDYINDNVKQIREFKNKDKFESLDLYNFHERIKIISKAFLDKIANLIIDDLYNFPEERLENLAGFYRDRMDKKSLLLFSKLLLE